MTAALLIPARYASSRFPGKPLAPLKGATGVAKSLIERTWEAGLAVSGLGYRAIATDDERIAEAATRFGAEVVMTSPKARNGTERCADALPRLSERPDLVVNLQGDAPLTPSWFVEALIETMQEDPTIAVATPVLRTDWQMVARLLEDRRSGRVGATTAVFAASGDALYFSKEVLPFSGAIAGSDRNTEVWHHVGVYAYRPDALERYMVAPEGSLERAEGLEQLRFLETGVPVRCVPVEARGAEFWELNNPSDIATIETVLAARGTI